MIEKINTVRKRFFTVVVIATIGLIYASNSAEEKIAKAENNYEGNPVAVVLNNTADSTIVN